MRRVRMSVCAVAVTQVLSQMAVAQTSAPTEGAQPASPAEEGIAEIIVSALRRDQSVSKAPAAITAIGGGDLVSQGVITSHDLPNVLPNVEVAVAGFSIRGVSSADFTEKGDPATAYNVDGVYYARFTEQQLSLFDVDRVEVLRGPQGTLYGRNATAGVINVITNTPKHEFQVAGSVEYGDYDTVRTSIMLNTPISENIDFRLSGVTNKHDGYTPTHDGFRAQDDQDDAAVRARLLVRFGESTRLLITGDYGQIDQVGPASLPVDRALAQNADHSLRYSLPGVDNAYRLKASGATVQLDSELGFASLTYVGSYRHSSFTALTSKNDVVPGNWDDEVTQIQHHEQTTHELRLASAGAGPFQWVGGLYYFHEHTPYIDYLNFVTGGFTLGYDLLAEATSYAAFGQGTYSLTDKLRLTAGARFTGDEKSRVGINAYSPNGSGLSFPSEYNGQYPGGVAPRNKVTWKGQLEADLAPSVLGYAGVATGYKAGGFNDGTPGTAPAGAAFVYQPETITSYEAGLKGTAFDRALYGALSVFHYAYNNHQVDAINPAGGAITFNAPAKVNGVELEGDVRPLKGTSLHYSASYLDAAFGHFTPGILLSPPNTTDLDGEQLDYAPKVSARLGLTQDFSLAQGGRLSADLSVKYSSAYYVTDYVNIVRYVQPAYTRTDVSLGYFAEGDKWHIQAFVKNLEDKRLLGLVEIGGFTLTDPLTFGVRAGFSL